MRMQDYATALGENASKEGTPLAMRMGVLYKAILM